MKEILPAHGFGTEVDALEAVVEEGGLPGSVDAIPYIRKTNRKPIPEALGDGVSLVQQAVEVRIPSVDAAVDAVVEAIVKARSGN